jgi:hypothetical protein
MYHRVGTYEGRTTLQELADRVILLEVEWEPSGYGVVKSIGDVYPELASVLPGEWVSSMLVLIRPGGNARVHRDARAREDIERFHLALQTNDRCWNLHDGAWQQLELGGIYTVDQTKEHASINWGDKMRVHLVADVAPVRATVNA